MKIDLASLNITPQADKKKDGLAKLTELARGVIPTSIEVAPEPAPAPAPEPELASTFFATAQQANASPADILRDQLDKLASSLGKATQQRQLLQLIHDNLNANPALKPTLLPQDMKTITATLAALSEGAHATKQTEKRTAVARTAVKNAKVAEVDNILGDLL